MSTIFNSHSQRDESIKNFFYRGFSGTSVVPIWQEYEETVGGPVDQEIERRIAGSAALFVLLSENVESLPYTRDWILWECGKPINKEIWVFEPYESLDKIKVVVPRFNHYVRYEQTKAWRDYINSIIKSYDDSGLLGWASAGAGIGAVLSENDCIAGAAFGSLAGAIVESVRRPKAPSGTVIRCSKCLHQYGIHIPGNQGVFRCVRCNNRMRLQDKPISRYPLLFPTQ